VLKEAIEEKRKTKCESAGDKMPLITNSSFSGNKYYRGKHIETILPALFRQVLITYTRERIELTDGDFLDLDWQKQNASKLVLLFHGLEGSSSSNYIKGFATHFFALGWDVCAVNFRSCSGEMNKFLRSYHSGATEDIDEVINHVLRFTQYQKITTIGFSLGGNILLKYLGEKKYTLPSALHSAIAFSVPIDLAASAIEMTKWQNTIYMNRFLKTLKQKVQLKANQFPKTINPANIERITTFYEFDSYFTGPIHGFIDAQDYYDKNNALRFLPRITIPTLLVNAQNDPFLTRSCFPTQLAKNHPFLYFEQPQYGGHVGFSLELPTGKYWSEQRAAAFIQSV